MSYNTKNYKEQGGDKWVVGGSLEVKGSDGNYIDVKQKLEAHETAIANGGGGDLAELTSRLTELTSRVSALENPVAINSFTIVNPNAPREVGQTLSRVTFSWEIENYSGTGAKLQDITSNLKLVDITSATKTHSQAVDVTKNTPGTQSYQLQITVGTKTINSTTRSINWYYPLFYGSSTKASGLTEAEIEAFTKNLKANAEGTYSFSAVEDSYKWIFVHESFNPTSFKSGGSDMPMQSPITITITNEFGVSINLKGYRTTNSTSSAIDLDVS